MTRNIIITSLCLFSLTSFGQNPTAAFDGKNWVAPYILAIPGGWDVERFLIPISFAPQIPYNGVEDIRFMPGWGNVNSNEYWTYAFLWYLNETPLINTETIENNLKYYYTGLITSNIEKSKVPADMIIATETHFKETEIYKGDLKTYQGTVYMFDYMAQKPITLNCIVHFKTCPGSDKTFVFYEISPKTFTENVWQNLNQLWEDFDCKRK
jgi:hypothetical protein